MSEIGMGEADGDAASDDPVTPSRTAALAGTTGVPGLALITMFRLKLPGARDQRGVTTVEYIFGALIGIAIVGCIAALFTTGVLNDMAEGVMKWIFGQRPKIGG